MTDRQPDDIGAAFAARVDTVQRRLAAHAAAPRPHGLTAPDQPTGERWDAGQVWAHITEFIGYWLAQAQLVIDTHAAGGAGAPVPFGRVKSDPARTAAIAQRRHEPGVRLFNDVERDLERLRDFLRSVPAAQWSHRGVHQTLGEMTTEQIVDEFLVVHLEQHADQLDQLASARREEQWPATSP